MFENRKDAGEQLGRALTKFRGEDVVVLGIPRGGVETAYYVAQYLQAKLSVVIARKLGHPQNPEYAFGAVAEDGSLYFVPQLQDEIAPATVQKIIEDQKREIERRVALYRKGKPLPSLKGKTVLLVDDGIATGATLFAAIALCKHMQAGKIVVAAPVGSPDTIAEMRDAVDEVVVLEVPSFFHAVSQSYQSFEGLEDQAALALLARWEKENQW